MKLYRGLKSDSFYLRTPEEEKDFQEKWRKILQAREAGEFSYPVSLNKEIVELQNKSRLSYQHFTDRKEIAEKYARDLGGVLIEIVVPIEEILEYFTLEFQNYSKRKESFELVYIVSSDILAEKQKEWQLTQTHFKDF